MPHLLRTIAQLGGVGVVTTPVVLYALSYKPYQSHSCPPELSRLGKEVAANIGRARDSTVWDCCEMVIQRPANGHFDALSLAQGFFGGRMFTAEMMFMKRMTRNVNDNAIIWQPQATRAQWSTGKRIANLFHVDSVSSSGTFVDCVRLKVLSSRMHITLTFDATPLNDNDLVRYRAAYSNIDPRSDAPFSRAALFLHRLYARILFQDAVRQLPLHE